jgi:putative ubiquitin-RnfH superfamily antitoxin RatB of RatAB toxin-antitoxin module
LTPRVRVHVAYVGPEGEFVVALVVPEGTTVADALHLAGAARRIGVPPDADGLAIFGQRVDGSTPLRDGDRIEITRPLACDPKVARRSRATASPTVRPGPRQRRRSAQ